MAIESLRDVARASVSAFAGGAAYFGNTAPDPAVFPRWYLLDGTYFEWDGAAWFQPPGADAGAAWDDITGKPATFAPSTHGHTAADISDFAASSRAQAEAALVAGANITITPSGTGASRVLTIAAAGGSGGGSPILSWMI